MVDGARAEELREGIEQVAALHVRRAQVARVDDAEVRVGNELLQRRALRVELLWQVVVRAICWQMNAAISRVADLQKPGLQELLLNIEVPLLCVGDGERTDVSFGIHPKRRSRARGRTQRLVHSTGKRIAECSSRGESAVETGNHIRVAGETCLTEPHEVPGGWRVVNAVAAPENCSRHGLIGK